jgi:hypothetical protein
MFGFEKTSITWLVGWLVDLLQDFNQLRREVRGFYLDDFENGGREIIIHEKAQSLSGTRDVSLFEYGEKIALVGRTDDETLVLQ